MGRGRNRVQSNSQCQLNDDNLYYVVVFSYVSLKVFFLLLQTTNGEGRA